MSRPKPNGSWGKVNGVPPSIPVASEVGVFEIDHNLPELVGTRRQIDWARNLRHEHLQGIFATLMDDAATLDDPKALYGCVDRLRATESAAAWIDMEQARRARSAAGQ